MTFVERFAPWSDQQTEAAARALRLVEEQGLEVVRVAFADQHGLLRGKTLMAAETANALHNGCSITSSLFAKDTANRTVFPVWTTGGGLGLEAFEGAGDVLMLPDPSTFRVLPWARKTGWLLADVYLPDGHPLPYATRDIFRSGLSHLAAAGYEYLAGLEHRSEPLTDARQSVRGTRTGILLSNSKPVPRDCRFSYYYPNCIGGFDLTHSWQHGSIPCAAYRMRKGSLIQHTAALTGPIAEPAPGWRRKFGGNHRRRNLRLIETKPKPVVSATVEITPCRRIARRQRRTYCWVPIGTTASRPVYERRSAGSSN